MTIGWKAVDQYFTVGLCVFQFYPVCNFGEFINFAFGTVRSERLSFKTSVLSCFPTLLVAYISKVVLGGLCLPLESLHCLCFTGVFFLNQYLDMLFMKDPQAGMDYHELQVIRMFCQLTSALIL